LPAHRVVARECPLNPGDDRDVPHRSSSRRDRDQVEERGRAARPRQEPPPSGSRGCLVVVQDQRLRLSAAPANRARKPPDRERRRSSRQFSRPRRRASATSSARSGPRLIDSRSRGPGVAEASDWRSTRSHESHRRRWPIGEASSSGTNATGTFTPIPLARWTPHANAYRHPDRENRPVSSEVRAADLLRVP